MKRLTVAVIMTCLATGAFAQDAVKDRQQAMKAIATSAKTLGDMASDKAPFDAAQAEQARVTMQQNAAQFPALFEPNVIEGETEALPAIWENWDDFVAKGAALEKAAADATTGSLGDVQTAMAEIGPTCRACHTDYRE
ncbi:cytochrome c [Cereibacter sp. SYSU M97828]|nr:cytochrome c [Cereibacter flavus]